MRIHYLQHVSFEDLANIELWATVREHSISLTKLFMNEVLPSVDQFDCLIVMGGPMNIYEEAKYPWLVREKSFILETIKAGKLVLGICLGGQLIADVLGGKVRKNKFKEIGWYQVTKTAEASESVFFDTLPQKFISFHWHGDTFDIPPGCTRIAESQGCNNQAFEYGGKVLAIQFHLESSKLSIEKLIDNCRDEIVDSKYVQSEIEILSKQDYVDEIKSYMEILLNRIESRR